MRNELDLDPPTSTSRDVAAAIANDDGFTALRAAPVAAVPTPVVAARVSVVSPGLQAVLDEPLPKFTDPPLRPRPATPNGIDWANADLHVTWHMVHAKDEVTRADAAVHRHWGQRERAAIEVKEAGGDPWAEGRTDVDLDVKFRWNDCRADDEPEFTCEPSDHDTSGFETGEDDEDDDGMAAAPARAGTSVENAIEVSPWSGLQSFRASLMNLTTTRRPHVSGALPSVLAPVRPARPPATPPHPPTHPHTSSCICAISCCLPTFSPSLTAGTFRGERHRKN